jgi:hypothetical protein
MAYLFGEIEGTSERLQTGYNAYTYQRNRTPEVAGNIQDAKEMISLAKRKVSVGDYVQTIHGVHGILIEVKPNGPYGDVAFIATADMRTFYCPIADLKDCEIVSHSKE